METRTYIHKNVRPNLQILTSNAVATGLTNKKNGTIFKEIILNLIY